MGSLEIGLGLRDFHLGSKGAGHSWFPSTFLPGFLFFCHYLSCLWELIAPSLIRKLH